MSSRHDTVLLDVDGTLVDTTYYHALAWVRAFRSLDVDVPLWEVHRAIGMGGDKLVAAVAGRRRLEKHHRGRPAPALAAGVRAAAPRGAAPAGGGRPHAAC